MQRMLGYMRKAIQEFDLIQDGDKIGVGVSGGKDSVVLLKGLVMLKRFIGIDYEVVAITLDPRFNGKDGTYKAMQDLCDELGIQYILQKTDIGDIIFEYRKEKHPCSLCARMRRGALHDICNANGCNKIALGHHYDDAVETFVMNLFIEGRIGCFSPKSYLSRKDISIIRPLAFAPEKEIRSCANRNNLPIVKSRCPVDGTTKRQETKEFLERMEKDSEGFKLRLFGAMRRGEVDGWGFKDK